MLDLLLLGAVGAFLGWIGEVLYCGLRYNNWMNRGFLHLPLTPMYGFATMVLHLTLNVFMGLETGIFILDNIFLFMYAFVLCALIEFVVGWGLKTIFKTTWWDYSDRFMNIKGYICLEMSIIFGVVGFIVIKFVYFPVINVINSIDNDVKLAFVSIFYTIGFIDFILVCIELVDYASLMIKLKKQVSILESSIENTLNDTKEKVELLIKEASAKRLHINYFVKSNKKHTLIDKLNKIKNK